MGLAIVEIAEFEGTVEEASEDTSKTYLVAINGEYRTKYGKPQYEFPSRTLLEEYKVKTYTVGNSRSWSDFYDLCTDVVENKNVFTKKLPQELIRDSVRSYVKDNKVSKNTENVEDIDEKDIESIVSDIISV